MKNFFLGLTALLCTLTSFSQTLDISEFARNGEVLLAAAKADIPDRDAFHFIASIDHKHSHDSVYFYIMEPEREAFNALNIPFRKLPHPNTGFKPEMIDVAAWEAMKTTNCATNLTAYPTYGLYETMMYDFAADFPDICRLVELGTLNSGRKILAVKISKNPDVDEAEPRFLYTSTMHGDETAGYILSLRLIQDLLCQYQTNERITTLIDSMEIWINPLANPNGTYHGGNHTVSNARRGNANNIDLNRNFPDPQYGNNPYGQPHQEETVIFMNLANDEQFDLSSNMHGGIEVLNYPWDGYQQVHADNAWWVHICRQYADTAQAHSPSGYFTALNNGITNGYAWYPVFGGRQDYMTYFRRTRETTLELTNIKLMPTTQFESRWNYNRRSLYNYMEQALYGLRGIVTDAISGLPLDASVSITGHDALNSGVQSRLPNGNYHRYLKAGWWSVTFAKEGYTSQTHSISIADNATTYLDVALQPETTCAVQGGNLTTESDLTFICAGDGNADLVQVSVTGNIGLSRFGLVTAANNIVASNTTGTFNMENLPGGTYRIAHLSYDGAVNLAGLTHVNQLEGCFSLSNFIQFSTLGVNGGQIIATGPTEVCSGTGSPSLLTFAVSGTSGPNKRWALLNASMTAAVAVQNSPIFDVDGLSPGTYRAVHVAYSDDVNLAQVEIQNPLGCLNTSNLIQVQVLPCAPLAPAAAGTPTVTVYPNPAADYCTAIYTNVGGGGLVLEVYSLYGKKISSTILPATDDMDYGQFRLPLQSFAEGMYLVGIRGEGGHATTRLVVTR